MTTPRNLSARYRALLTAAFSIFVLSSSLTAQVAASQADSAPATPPANGTRKVAPVNAVPSVEKLEEAIELSPFVVQSSQDKGYDAANTLSGTRLNTPARYVGAASFEVTEALMKDLNLTNMQDLINFTPNASSYAGGGITNDTTGNSAIFGVQYNVRGLSITTVNRDFLNYRVADDAYNIERFSFTRGPNSILFGIGQPGGVVNSISKRANSYKDSYQVSARFDTNDSRRYTADINKVLIPKKLALRISGLTEVAMTRRKPSDREADRLYGALIFQPTRSTTIRVNGEHGKLNSLAVRPWIASNGTIAWVAAGSNEIPAQYLNGGANYAQLSGAPAGSPSVAVNRAALTALGFETQLNVPVPLFAYDNSGKTPTAVINNNGFVFTGRPTQTNGDRFQSWADNPPIPYEANVLGYGNSLIQDIDNYMISVEQRFGQNFYVEGTFSKRRLDNQNNYSSGVDDNLYLDKNKTYLGWNGQVVTNPHYNQYFTYNANAQGYLQWYDDETSRITASYELDFRKGKKTFVRRILGHHNFAALAERSVGTFQQDFFVLANTSPQLITVPQFSVANQNTPISSNNRTNFINYITPGDESTYYSRNYWSSYPGYIYDGTPLPTPNASGITPAWTASTSTRSRQTIDSLMAVAQSFFWDDKIVTTFGVRRDTSDLWNLANYVNPTTNRVANAGSRDLYANGTNLKYAGNTYTQGVVVTPVPWLGLFYNRSNSFVPPTGVRVDLFGTPLGSGTGEGQDYGIKLYMFGGKLTGTISRYTTDYKGVVTGVFRGGSTSLLPAMSGIIAAMNDSTQGGPGGTYWSGLFPWPAGNLGYSSLNDIDGSGYEFSLSANPTRNLRLTANFSHQKTIASNFGGTETRWVNEVAYGYFKDNPQYLGLLTGAGPQGSNETIAQRLQDMTNVLSLSQSLNGKADARQSQYSANFVAGYDFTRGLAKGFSVGATYQWRSKMIIGYPYVTGRTDLFQTDKPYYSDDTHNLGAWIRYGFSFRKVRAQVQLNVVGLNNDDGIHPYTMIDTGNGTPVVERYILGPGRSFALQTTFNF